MKRNCLGQHVRYVGQLMFTTNRMHSYVLIEIYIKKKREKNPTERVGYLTLFLWKQRISLVEWKALPSSVSSQGVRLKFLINFYSSCISSLTITVCKHTLQQKVMTQIIPDSEVWGIILWCSGIPRSQPPSNRWGCGWGGLQTPFYLSDASGSTAWACTHTPPPFPSPFLPCL